MGRSSPYVSLEEERDARAEAARDPVPFLILTGFLGAGKTTLLNRFLSAPQGRRVAVLVNDVGQINIDRKLIEADAGDIIELSGGCVCCQIDLQRDLFSGVDDLVERAQPDLVVLETTGIADPGVLLAAFDEVQSRRRHVTPAGVVCVVDAELGLAAESRPEWTAQLTAADRIVLTKLERASSIGALHARLEGLAPGVERAAFPTGKEGDHVLARYLLDMRAHARRAAPGPHRHSQLSVFAFSEATTLALEPLQKLIEDLGVALVRCKGFAHVVDAGEARWLYVERAGVRTTYEPREPVGNHTELVFIVEERSISEESLRRQLWACRVGA